MLGGLCVVAPVVKAPGRESDAVGAQNLPAPGAASSYQIDRWETEQGLPENSATAVAQTPDGYLWFGTFNGLVRFDGIRFTVLNPSNTPQLPGAAVVNLHQDRSGRLWVSTDRGLVTIRDHHWRSYGTNEGWAGNYVRSFSERADGDLLVSTFDGHLLEFTGDRFHELPPPPRANRDGYVTHVDEDGRWWAIRNNFAGRWISGAWVETIRLPALTTDSVGCGTARDGSLILIAGRKVEHWNRGVRTASLTLPEPPGGVWSVSEDWAGNLWICTFDKGLCQIRPDGSFLRWTTTEGLSHPSTRCLFEDSERNLWVGTSGGGLMRFKPRRFQVFGTESGFTERTIRSIAADGTNGQWVATYGRGVFHLEAGRATEVPLTAINRGAVYLHSILRDRDHRVWLGALGSGIWQMDSDGIRRIPGGDLGCATVFTVFEDTQGRVWFGGERALGVREAGRIRKFTDDAGATVPGVSAMAEPADGSLWLSNSERVYRLASNHLAEVRTPESRPLNDVLCFLPDADGALWMGTRNDGLLHRQSGHLKRVDRSAGLPADGVHGILEDGLGYVWMTSRRGVTRARKADLTAVVRGDLDRLSCQLLDTADGLVSRDCPGGQQPVAMKGPDGRLWFATLKGVATIDPGAFRLNVLPPPVHIESLQYRPEHPGALGAASTESILALEPPFESRISLPAGSHGLEIRYTALNFAAPEKLRFQVMLEPVEQAWRDEAGSRSTYYHELRPGDYRFRVRAANNDGVWNEQGAALAFAVRPYPWQTRWFIAGIALFLVGLGAVIARWRSQTIHRRSLVAADLERRHQAEVAHFGRVAGLGQMASSIAHELNQPLGAILRNAEAGELLLRQPTPDTEELRAILADIRQDDHRAGEVIGRMRTLLRHGEVRAAEVDSAALIRDVAKLVDFEARSRQAELVLDLSPSLPKVVGDRVQLQQVVLNLLLNALDAVQSCPRDRRRVTLRAFGAEDALVVSVSDLGTGIPPDRLPQIFNAFHTSKPDGLGMGLTIARTIVEAHGGTLTAANGPERGAVFRFTVPIPPAAAPS